MYLKQRFIKFIKFVVSGLSAFDMIYINTAKGQRIPVVMS